MLVDATTYWDKSIDLDQSLLDCCYTGRYGSQINTYSL